MNIYYVALGVVWCILWSATALLFGRLPDDIRQHYLDEWHSWSVAGMTARATEHRTLVFALIVVPFGILYVLSYAPATTAVGAGGLPWMRDMMDFYVPVEWLIDQSPLREALLDWGALWGTREDFVSASTARRAFWGTIPPWLYAIGWSALGIICVAGPAFILRMGLIRLLRSAVPVAAKAQ